MRLLVEPHKFGGSTEEGTHLIFADDDILMHLGVPSVGRILVSERAPRGKEEAEAEEEEEEVEKEYTFCGQVQCPRNCRCANTYKAASSLNWGNTSPKTSSA